MGNAVFYRDLHFLDAGVNVQDCVVARADDGLVFDDDDLKTRGKRTLRRYGVDKTTCSVRL